MGKHNRFPAESISPDMQYLGSVRNPWDWYLSLWAYGCDGRGTVMFNTIRGQLEFQALGFQGNGLRAVMQQHQKYSQHPELWHDCYRDVRDPGCFRQWLQMLHDPAFMADAGEGFAASPVAAHTGLLSFRYMQLFWREGVAAATGLADYSAADQQQCYINHFIRNEQLEDDLLSTLVDGGYPLSEEQRASILGRAHTNASSSRDSGVQYYDAAAAELVARRDRLIIDKFGYQSPVQ